MTTLIVFLYFPEDGVFKVRPRDQEDFGDLTSNIIAWLTEIALHNTVRKGDKSMDKCVRIHACPYCGHEEITPTKFYSKCGKKVGHRWIVKSPPNEGIETTVRVCPKCGKEFKSGEIYCPDHGEKIIDRVIITPVIYK